MFCNNISFLQAHHISQIVCKSYFCWTQSQTNGISNALQLHVQSCIHPTPADYHCCCAHFSSVFVIVMNSISQLNLIKFIFRTLLQREQLEKFKFKSCRNKMATKVLLLRPGSDRNNFTFQRAVQCWWNSFLLGRLLKLWSQCPGSVVPLAMFCF